MRMEKISPVEKEVNAKSKSKDSDCTNHILSKNENSINSSSNDEISEAKDVSANDADLGRSQDGLVQNETDKDAGVNDTTNLNSASISENKSIEINGDVNNKPDEDLVESNSPDSDKSAEVNKGNDVSPSCDDKLEGKDVSSSCDDKLEGKDDPLSRDDRIEENDVSSSCNDKLEGKDDSLSRDDRIEGNDVSPSCNDKLENKSKKIDDNSNSSTDKNDSKSADSSQLDTSSLTDKNITNTSCDSEDYHSATESNELASDQNKPTDEIQEVTNDEVDNSAVRQDAGNVENTPKISEENEKPSNSPEPMEVDESLPSSSITEDKDENEVPQINENSESSNENVENRDKNETSESTSNDQEDSGMNKSNENSESANENPVSSKDDDETSNAAEQCNEAQITENSSKESNKDVDNTAKTDSTNETSSPDDAANDENVNKSTTNPSATSDAKESTSDENSDPKNTEVLHIDENDEDPDEVMDISECDPFGQVTQNTTEAEVMEVDGTSSNKDVQNERANAELVIDVNLSDENSTNSDSIPKSTQEKPSTENAAEQTEENCIIPDKMTNEATKTTKPKFDITPVRLEKLMDPSKLASAQVKNNEKVQERSNEVSSDFESNNLSVTSRPQRRAAKKAESQIKEIVAQTENENYGSIEEVDKLSEPSLQVCYRCSRLRQCQYAALCGSKTVYICQESCLNSDADKKRNTLKVTSKLQLLIPRRPSPFPNSIHCLRKCSQCNMHNISDQSLTWEAMDFCNEDCLNSYQVQHGSYCAHCKGAVQHTSMGKYSVRFGLEARQFCSGTCLEEFKKGLKSCSYCQHDITKATSVVSAQVVDKGPMKDFCSQSCVEKYDRMSTNSPLPITHDNCTVCAEKKDVEVQVLIQSRTHSLCSDVCFMTFKFANNISDIDQCYICMKFYEEGNPDSHFVFHDDTPYNFCSNVCMNVFILFRRKIVPCSWCKVKKYNFDMIRKSCPGGSCVMMCSLNCLTLYQVSMNATSTRKIKCDLCSAVNFAQYHLTMSDATIRNFCSYNCVMVFQTQYNKTPLTMHEPNKSNTTPVPMGAPKRGEKVVPPTNDFQRNSIQKVITTIANGLLPQLTSATTLKVSSPLTAVTATGQNSAPLMTTTSTVKTQTVTKYIQQVIVKPPAPKEMSNKITQCGVNTANKHVSCQPEITTQETQTDEASKYPAVIPIPVPVYVPAPMHMFTTPFPVPVPFALPIPVPIFIPTTKSTYKAITQHMKEILDKTPSNPFEADLLLMAKMVASEDKTEETEEVAKNESGEEDEMHFADAAPEPESFADSETSTSNNFADDVLQMAMKMATEQLSNSPTVDLEAELTSNTITPQTQTEDTNDKTEEVEVPAEPRPTRTRKRANKSAGDTPTRKRGRPQTVTPTESDSQTTPPPQSSNATASPVIPESERPDVNMCLKFTIGIRAWKQWLLAKNDQIEQAAVAANKKAKTFNLNILKLTTDELNYLLCLFVKEVRKPNGVEYAPDTVYYLCLSIQQYLFENGRIDNIFTDSFYEPFTNALDEVAKKFSEINDATQYIVTRVEEEHLWESKQLGAHSPHVLLATLMFFNTKYFNLATLEEHMQLSFSHIMKHWKRNPNAPVGKPGSPAPNRNVVLRFYPPQAALDAPNSRKKKVYEQHENEVNPLRCPVKLYEFYLSKCPESVKQRNDVFYLQPERSCVPDSPVWYSTMPLQKDLLMKMLHRIRMVKEVNVSLLAS